MKFSRKSFGFTLENLHGKLIFSPFFALFSRVPEAVGEFFASYFFPFAVFFLGGGIFPAGVEFKRVGGGEEFPHPPVCQRLEDALAT